MKCFLTLLALLMLAVVGVGCDTQNCVDEANDACDSCLAVDGLLLNGNGCPASAGLFTNNEDSVCQDGGELEDVYLAAWVERGCLEDWPDFGDDDDSSE
jgi:hypothetical protein